MMIIKNLKLRKWRKYKYEDSVDYTFEQLIAKKTKFDATCIYVWYAAKINNSSSFNHFKFQYIDTYYDLTNDILTQITEETFLNKKKKAK